MTGLELVALGAVAFPVPSQDAVVRITTQIADSVLAITAIAAAVFLVLVSSLWVLLAVSRLGKPGETLPWTRSGDNDFD